MTTKPCKSCGKLLFNVSSAVRYYDKCAAEKKAERRRRDNEKRKSLKPKGRPKGMPQMTGEKARKKRKKALLPYTKSIKQCVHESEALGLTYGKFVALGYDKEEIL
nr:MAG TPA: hypothetical protein [Caudoviricetes sp.]